MHNTSMKEVVEENEQLENENNGSLDFNLNYRGV
jgi:hypothetical protein